MTDVVVIDTNVFISALLGPSRQVIRACLQGQFQPLMGAALFHEYEVVMGRDVLFGNCRLSVEERTELLDAFLSVCRWIRVYYLWRPNLRDEGDHHLIELAVAGGARYIVTQNLKDLRSGELDFAGLRMISPDALLTGEPER